MNILLIPNMDKFVTKAYLDEIIKILKKENFNIFLDSKYEEFVKSKKIVLGLESELLKNSDFVITIGGDGTILMAAKKAAIYNIPVLGINSGRLGFLTSLETSELHLLENLLKQDKEIENRMLINVQIKRNKKLIFESDALNEVVIKNSDTSSMVELVVECDGRFVNDYRADGLIFATPTGSTAYNLSAGGPIISPNVASITVTPICPHSLFSRSIVFPSASIIKVSIPTIHVTDFAQNLEVNVDGHSDFYIKSDDEMIITQSKLVAKTVYVKNRKFYDVLNLKIMGR